MKPPIRWTPRFTGVDHFAVAAITMLKALLLGATLNPPKLSGDIAARIIRQGQQWPKE